MKSECVEKIPPSIKIECDDTAYWVYFSKDVVQCFLCKEIGHIAKYCKAADTQADGENSGDWATQSITKNAALEEVIVSQAEIQGSLSDISDLSQVRSTLPPPQIPAKRGRPASIASSGALQDQTAGSENVNIKPSVSKKKKLKTNKPNIAAVFAAVTVANKQLNDENKYPEETLENISKFLTQCYGARNVREKALEYTSDVAELSSVLKNIAQTLTDTNLKSRVGRIVTNLEKKGAHDDDSMSDSSIFSDGKG